MSKRRKKQSGGVPEWVVTYGDMMSLLLCFFILLAAFSELKRDHEYQRVITAVKEAFGFSGGVGVLPTDDPPLRSMLELLEELEKQTKSHSENTLSETNVEGVRGKETRVSKVREGMMFTIGGGLTFEPGSATLKPEAAEEIVRVSKMLQGKRNKIAVRGHAASMILPEGSPFEDLMDLSYFRAKAVAHVLATEGGIDERLIAIEARGDTEPLEGRRYSVAAQTANRRVEIIMTEVMIEEMAADADTASQASARGDTPADEPPAPPLPAREQPSTSSPQSPTDTGA